MTEQERAHRKAMIRHLLKQKKQHTKVLTGTELLRKTQPQRLLEAIIPNGNSQRTDISQH